VEAFVGLLKATSLVVFTVKKGEEGEVKLETPRGRMMKR
jgi:hypothetical protein